MILLLYININELYNIYIFNTLVHIYKLYIYLFKVIYI